MAESLFLHAYITGRVQGVGFRMNTKWKADGLGLSGWVRNLYDGRVETLAHGSPSSLDAFLKWLHEGPRFARVEHVEHQIFINVDSMKELPSIGHSFRIIS